LGVGRSKRRSVNLGLAGLVSRVLRRRGQVGSGGTVSVEGVDGDVVSKAWNDLSVRLGELLGVSVVGFLVNKAVGGGLSKGRVLRG
jgi:hypothetical protein